MRHHLNSEERERGSRLNESIAEVMRLHDDCIYGLRDYFNEGLNLSKYIQLKADLAPDEAGFKHYRAVFLEFMKTEEAMQEHVLTAQRLEVKLHQYVMQSNRLFSHLDSAASACERGQIFAELEADTDDMLLQVVKLKGDITQDYFVFTKMRKRLEVEDAN